MLHWDSLWSDRIHLVHKIFRSNPKLNKISAGTDLLFHRVGQSRLPTSFTSRRPVPTSLPFSNSAVRRTSSRYQIHVRIEELDKKLVGLRADIRKLNDQLSPGDGKIIVLGEEILILWTMLSKNNFDIHVLKSESSLLPMLRRLQMLLQNGGSRSQQFERALQHLDLFNISS
ncbi:hypothetical protein LINPERHAP1_LOCUS2669 [Linum perenne]